MNKMIFISIIGVCINLIAMYASLIFSRDTINTKVILHMIPILGFLILGFVLLVGYIVLKN